MEVKDVEIIIPEGYVVDEEKSTFTKIVFKRKSLDYDDVAIKLFCNKRFYFIAEKGDIKPIEGNNTSDCLDANNATSEHQLECILAKNKLANVARYLNGDWGPVPASKGWYLVLFSGKKVGICATDFPESYLSSRIVFKTRELAEEAIKILSGETIKLALEPLY